MRFLESPQGHSPRRALVVAAAVVASGLLVTGGVAAGYRVFSTTAGATAAATPSEVASTTSVVATSTPPPSKPTPSAEPTTVPASAWNLHLHSGPWPTPHVQGIAVDQAKGYIYYSFTRTLVKTDLSGKLIGTVTGFTGHLGDLDFNTSDGKVYGSLEYKAARAFYIAVFDVDRITRVGMNAQNSTLVSTVYLPEVVKDFTADLDGNGRFAGDTANTADHRYGCSGIDGLTFGPKFGSNDGDQYLTVAYGIYPNNSRSDNDHQVLLQYDIGNWESYERPLIEGTAHRQGPEKPLGKYFVYTGNTKFGVQSLDYDPWLGLWLLSAYHGSKAEFPNYSLFAIDAAAQPSLSALRGLPGESGLLLPLAALGLDSGNSGIRGWRREVPFGLQSLGGGLYYTVASTSTGSRSSARLSLETWSGNAKAPLSPAKKKG